MNEALGVLEILESRIIEATRMPFSTKVIMEEKQLLELLDKLRLLIQTQNQELIRNKVALNNTDDMEDTGASTEDKKPLINSDSTAIIIKAKEEAKMIKKSMDEYSDNVLARLQLLITKLQKNLIRLEKNIDDSRIMISSSSTVIEKEGVQ